MRRHHNQFIKYLIKYLQKGVFWVFLDFLIFFFSWFFRNLQECDFFTKDGMPKTPFPNGWKGENGLYTVGFTRRGLQGTAFDAVKIAQDISEQCRNIKDLNNKTSNSPFYAS